MRPQNFCKFFFFVSFFSFFLFLILSCLLSLSFFFSFFLLFLPPSSLTQKKNQTKNIHHLATNHPSWTVRFVDYFALLGPTAPTSESLRDSRIPDDLEVSPILLDSIPREPEHPDMPIPPELAAFCCPNGMKLRTKDSIGGVPQPQHFAQVLAVGTVGTTVYCYCVTFYDPMKPNDLINMFTEQRLRSSSIVSNGSTTSIASSVSNTSMLSFGTNEEEQPHAQQSSQYPAWFDPMNPHNNPIVYAPKTMVILSHWPFLSVYREFLTQTLRMQR